MNIAPTQPKKPYKSLPMEGMIATWYAKSTARDMRAFETEAAGIAERLRQGSDVLEVAPGPGYLAIALARRGDYRIVGLGISRSSASPARTPRGRRQCRLPAWRRGRNAVPIRCVRLHRLPRGVQEFQRS